MSDLEEIQAFRNRLVEFFNHVVDSYNRGRSSAVVGIGDPEIDDSAIAHIHSEQVVLTQEYGRLRDRIRRAAGGIPAMRTHAVGVISQDVIVDAINRIDWHNWSDATTMAQQHLDLVIGHLRSQRRTADPDRLYRITNPLYWLAWLFRLIGRVLSSWRGRLVTLAIFVIAAIATGILEDFGRSLWRMVFP